MKIFGLDLGLRALSSIAQRSMRQLQHGRRIVGTSADRYRRFWLDPPEAQRSDGQIAGVTAVGCGRPTASWNVAISSAPVVI
ncbi:MAG TPA: hypothetical protein EYQ31_05565 [Candidatus Handelsmanbacteria bacterium]|nr:hypothetical protein [Candidatus Handelsmanbacteria bacterium]